MSSDPKNAIYALISALQTITAQTQLHDFLAAVLRELEQMTGATRLFVLLNDGNDVWQIAAGLVDQQSVAPIPLDVAHAEQLIFGTAVYQCLKSKSMLVIDDLAVDKSFTGDAYFNSKRQGSLLVLPVIDQETLPALLLLENQHTTSAFSSSCVENLKIFANQIALCLQHIQRYSLLERQFTQFVQSSTLTNAPSFTIEKTDAESPFQEILSIAEWTEPNTHSFELTDKLQRHSYQQFLAKGQSLFHLLADNAPFAIILLNQENQTLYVNNKFCELLGYQKEDIPTLAEWRRQVLPDAELDAETQQHLNLSKNEAFFENTALSSSEFLVTDKEGVQKYLALTFVSQGIYKAIIGTEFTKRRQNNFAFCNSEACFQIVFEKNYVGIAISDNRGFLLKVNDRFAAMMGCSSEYMIGKNCGIFCHPDDKPAEIELYHRCMKGEIDEFRLEKRWVRLSGEIFWADHTATLTRDAEGNPEFFIGITIDITERKKTDAALVASEQRFKQLFNKSPLPLAILRPMGNISLINTRFIDNFGYSSHDLPNINAWWTCAFPNLEARRMAMETWMQAVKEARKKCTDIKPNEFLITCKNGQTRTIIISGVAVGEDMLLMFLDITEQKHYQKKLEHIAHYDSLTNLPNRVLFADRLSQSMNRARRQNQNLAVIYLDLDGFKAINDTHGHEAGDHLLLIVATRLKFALRDSDTIARLGGDEFVAVIQDVKDMSSFTPLISRLLEAAKQPVISRDRVLQVSASLGITFYPQTEEVDADQLLRQSDQAMYQAKLMGKNCFIVFDSELDRNIRGQNESIEQIRTGFSKNQFMLHYQPKVNLHTGEVMGVEALIRWHHPADGLKTPEKFLPIIENNLLIIEIGEWVIDQALYQIEQWQVQGLMMSISINIAALHLQQLDFVERLRLMLASHPQVNPSMLELEVLESSAIEDMERAYSVIQGCLDLGVCFALDDFGTGYSSLSYLKRLPVKILKIDRCFVHDMLHNPEDLAILEGVLGLASASRRQVIAEGVESSEHAEMLLQIGCIYAQGYGIATPMQAKELPEWIRTWRPNPEWIHCSALGREELTLLSAIVEHRAWIKAIGQFLEHPLTISLSVTESVELTNWLERTVNRYQNQFEEFSVIRELNKQLQNVVADLVLNQRIEQASEIQGVKITTFHTLSNLLDKKLTLFLKNLQKFNSKF